MSEEDIRSQTKALLAEARAKMDMTPKSMAETFRLPPEIVAATDHVHSRDGDLTDALVEQARFDLERCPDLTGLVYGYFIARMLRGDTNVLTGILGESLLRLARLPDYEKPDSDIFEKYEGDAGVS